MANELQVSLEKSDGLKRILTVEVPSEQITSEVTKRLKKVAKTAKIKGFRKGKVPMPVIKQNYGEAVKHEVIGDVMQKSYAEAIQQQDIVPAGNPSIDADEYKDGESFTYKATIEVYPEVELADLSNIKVEKLDAEIQESDVDMIIDNMRSQKANWETVNRVSRKADRVVIDFEGKVDGEVFEGGKAENTPVVIGEGRMLPDFESGVVGLKAGETKDIEVGFPEDYHAENLKGKTATFEISVISVEEKVLPTIDEEFAKEFGVESGDVDQLRTEVRENMQKELENTIEAKLKDQVMDAILINNEIDVPEALVGQEIHNLQHDWMQRMGLPNDHSYHPPAEQFTEDAKKRVRLGLLLGELVKQEDIKVEDADLDAQLDKLTDGYEDVAAIKQAYKAQPKFMQQIHMMALEAKVVDFVTAKGTVTEATTTFQEIMNVNPMT